MTTELTAQTAFDGIPRGVGIRYTELDVNNRREIDAWFDSLKAHVAAERDKDVESLRTALRHATERESRMTFARDTLAEDARRATLRCQELQAELDRLKPKPPKPRKTAGEKLASALVARVPLSRHWSEMDDDHRRRVQAAAVSLGLMDDPEPPSDGLLLKRACEKHRHPDDSCETSNWGFAAAEFLRLRAERDGGGA
jgi:hypothetical protein